MRTVHPMPDQSTVTPLRPPLVTVDKLTVDMPLGRSGASVRIVDGVDFSIGVGERVALVGESGSGKSLTARALMRLDRLARLSGRVDFDGTDLLKLSDRDMGRLRGSSIAMVFQDPMSFLDPLMTIGDQVAETLRIRGIGKAEARKRALAVLDELGVDRAAQRLDAYPHEFSGGMRQRVVLAMALIGEPRLLIADEPTTALDVRVQDQVLDLLDDVSTRRGLAVLFITHDLGVVAGFAERVDGHVFGPHRRGWRSCERIRQAEPSLHTRADQGGAAHRPGSQHALRHPRCAAATTGAAGRLPIPSALRSALRTLRQGPAHAIAGRSVARRLPPA